MVAGDLRTKRNIILACIFIIAIFLRLAMSLYYFDISGDKIYQIAAAVSINKGDGYTVPSVNPNNLDQVLNKPMILWPPLYSVILAPVITLTENPAMASFVLDIAANIFFLLLIVQICSILGFPMWLKILTLLYKATEINEVVVASTPTDYLALDLWLASILAAVWYLKRCGNMAAIIFIILNALTPWLRYASIPVVVVLPAVVIISGLWKKDQRIIRTGLIAGIVAIASMGLLLFYNQYRSGSFFFVLETTRGFYPGNLLYMPAIAWTSIVNTSFILTQASIHSGIYYGTLNDILKTTSLLALIVLAIYVVKRTSWKSFRQVPNYFFFLTTSLSLATIGSLAWLSITRSRNYLVDRLWTYIEDHRYMLIITTTIFFYLLYEFILRRKNSFMGLLLVFILVCETAHGIWVISKRPLTLPGNGSYNSGAPKTQQLIIDRNAEASRLGKQLIIVDESYDLRGFAVLNNMAMMDDPQDLDRIAYGSTNIKRIFLRIGTGHEPLYKTFLTQPGVRQIARFEQAVFYELDVPVKK
jgi:hypothetical protein